jgi:hypothetical protein
MPLYGMSHVGMFGPPDTWKKHTTNFDIYPIFGGSINANISIVIHMHLLIQTIKHYIYLISNTKINIQHIYIYLYLWTLEKIHHRRSLFDFCCAGRPISTGPSPLRSLLRSAESSPVSSHGAPHLSIGVDFWAKATEWSLFFPWGNGGFSEKMASFHGIQCEHTHITVVGHVTNGASL